jgi:hypothetical protein
MKSTYADNANYEWNKVPKQRELLNMEKTSFRKSVNNFIFVIKPLLSALRKISFLTLKGIKVSVSEKNGFRL